jgi:hypothetical protein
MHQLHKSGHRVAPVVDSADGAIPRCCQQHMPVGACGTAHHATRLQLHEGADRVASLVKDVQGHRYLTAVGGQGTGTNTGMTQCPLVAGVSPAGQKSTLPSMTFTACNDYITLCTTAPAATVTAQPANMTRLRMLGHAS